MRYFHVAALAAFFALLANAAVAQTTWDAMQSFGLTGTWSPSCQTAPSPSNYWMTYYLDSAGVVRRRVDLGPSRANLMNAVDSAQIMTATTIDTHIRNDDPGYGATNGLVFDVIIVKQNGHVRTLASQGSDGKAYISDGIVIANGQPSVWLEKCSD